MHSKATAVSLGSNAFVAGGHVTMISIVNDTQLRKQRPCKNGRFASLPSSSALSTMSFSMFSHRVASGLPRLRGKSNEASCGLQLIMPDLMLSSKMALMPLAAAMICGRMLTELDVMHRGTSLTTACASSCRNPLLTFVSARTTAPAAHRNLRAQPDTS